MKQFILPAMLLLSATCFCQGNTYMGSYKQSGEVIRRHKRNVKITGLEILYTKGFGISLVNDTNVTITNCRIKGTALNAINVSGCVNVKIVNCIFDSVPSGVYAVLSKTVSVVNCTAINMLGPLPRGQMVQFDEVTGHGNRINNNIDSNVLGISHQEDGINLYKSSGVKTDSIQVIGNRIVGSGGNPNGSGIQTGDGGSGSYAVVKNNTLINPGQVGIAVSGGRGIAVYNNFIYAEKNYFTNVGLCVWKEAGTCKSILVYKNTVSWVNRDGNINNVWNGGGCGIVKGWETNILKTGEAKKE